MSEQSGSSMLKTVIFYGVFVFGIFLLPGVSYGAFGISPAVVTLDHLVPGSEFTQTVYLVQDKPDIDLPITTTLDVPSAVQKWITIDQGMSFVIPKGTNQFPVRITVNVPKGVSLGVWTGKISFVGTPKQSGQITIALGAQAIINLKVGNDIYDKFSVPLIRLLDVEEGWNPRVYVKFQNEGNVPNGFTGATYELFDKFGEIRLAYAQKNSGFPDAPAFTTKEYTIEFPMDFHMGIGQYWGTVNFYKNDTIVASQRTVFNVLEKGSLAKSPFASILPLLGDSRVRIGIGIVLLIGFGFFLRRRLKRKHRA